MCQNHFAPVGRPLRILHRTNGPLAPVKQRLRQIYTEHGEKLRFLIVGVWNTAFSYAAFAALLYLLEPALKPMAASDVALVRYIGEHWYIVAQWASWVIAVPQSTIALKYLVFHSKGRLLPEIGRAFFVYLPMQALSSVSLWFLVSIVGLHPLAGQLVTIGVTAVLSYLGHKHFTFRDWGRDEHPTENA